MDADIIQRILGDRLQQFTSKLHSARPRSSHTGRNICLASSCCSFIGSHPGCTKCNLAMYADTEIFSHRGSLAVDHNRLPAVLPLYFLLPPVVFSSLLPNTKFFFHHSKLVLILLAYPLVGNSHFTYFTHLLTYSLTN